MGFFVYLCATVVARFRMHYSVLVAVVCSLLIVAVDETFSTIVGINLEFPVPLANIIFTLGAVVLSGLSFDPRCSPVCPGRLLVLRAGCTVLNLALMVFLAVLCSWHFDGVAVGQLLNWGLLVFLSAYTASVLAGPEYFWGPAVSVWLIFLLVDVPLSSVSPVLRVPSVAVPGSHLPWNVGLLVLIVLAGCLRTREKVALRFRP